VSFWDIVTCIKVTNVSDIDSDRIYVSCDVIFDEGIFPFSKISSSSNQPTQPNPPHDLRTLHVNNSSINLENDHMFSSVPANNLVAGNPVSSSVQPVELSPEPVPVAVSAPRPSASCPPPTPTDAPGISAPGPSQPSDSFDLVPVSCTLPGADIVPGAGPAPSPGSMMTPSV
jgi:hypothetical protein